jgi:hypothetical protein
MVIKRAGLLFKQFTAVSVDGSQHAQIRCPAPPIPDRYIAFSEKNHAGASCRDIELSSGYKYSQTRFDLVKSVALPLPSSLQSNSKGRLERSIRRKNVIFVETQVMEISPVYP